MSYDRLRGYRDELTRALYEKIQSGVESPQAFAAYARSLTIAPGPGALLHAADVVQAFVRDVFLTGNGTLFVNNTFVEWAAVQALRRAQPRLLVARYGVRDKMKPFSSLLLFSQPRASDQIPLIEDPVGSFVDVEQLSYYVWLNAEKSAGLPPEDALPVPRRRRRRDAGDPIGRRRAGADRRRRAPAARRPRRRRAPRWRSGWACPRRTRGPAHRAPAWLTAGSGRDMISPTPDVDDRPVALRDGRRGRGRALAVGPARVAVARRA